MNKNFSFIVLTYNEEIHLPRLLKSIRDLNAPLFILDSGSTDSTLKIAAEFQAEVKVNTFVNHPKQWDFALKNFDIQTPWIIGLDADQIVTPELFKLLAHFKDEDYNCINSIYFNRKNYFRGKWIRFGGYYPFYLLKMFRNGVGFSDLNENMDHRFIVPGKTKIWKEGFLLEDNLKEYDTDFWFKKHERYSDLIAEEEIERQHNIRNQTIKPSLLGSPDEQRAWFKNIWWKLPLGFRPYLYFLYRMLFKFGIFEGRKGIYFHYLQGFWFRMQVDKKIKALKIAEQHKTKQNR
ncbi:glycosyltransferase family 2 protein [Pedobacter aquatilis]|uniref:glycosyltransferase family 2 protein n=1 Tax=Pedobacter aquatilis TaxID=351343 RepID=UPI00292CF859|nr:glycosyltransferase family 2 protein [Pedobacter aquatilis]